MKPIVLIVEDRAASLPARSRLFTKLGMVVVTAQSQNEAVEKFNFLPNVDLIICDYNLDEENDQDAGGVNFAKFLRKQGFKGPMVLYSGRDNVDIAPNVVGMNADGITEVSEDVPFDDAAQKAQMPEEKRNEWLGRAIEHMKQRHGANLSLVDSLSEKYEMSPIDFTKLVELIPGSEVQISRGKADDGIPFSNLEFETQARKSGMRAMLIGGSNSSDEETIELNKPMMVWVRESASEIFVEAVGCSDISARGENEKDAILSLILRMRDAKDKRDEPQHVRDYAAQFI